MHWPAMSGRKLKAEKKPAARRGSRQLAEPVRYTLDCRIESGAHLYYEILPDGGVMHISEPAAGTTLVSAVYAPSGRADDDTADDYRYQLPKKMGASQASGHVQRELGLFRKLRSVVQGGAGMAVWACSEEKILARERVMPFAWALERLMSADSLLPPCVTGVLFGESDLLILLAFPGNGRVFVQTSVSPDNLVEIISSFASINSISVEIGSVPVYTGAEFLVALAGTPLYPLETDLAGIPVPWLARGALAVSAFLLAASLGGGLYFSQRTEVLVRQSQRLSAERQQIEAAVIDRLQSNPQALGRLLAADWPSLLDHAAKIWVDGARVESSATSERETHVLVLPLHESGWMTGSSQLAAALHPPALPAGCHADGYSVTASGGELRARYECDRNPALVMLQPSVEVP